MKKNIILKRKKMFFIIFALLFCLSLETCKSLHDSKLNNNIWYQNLDNFSLNTTNTWCEFDLNHEALEEHTCAWIGSITFKSKNAFKLKRLNLKWTGKYINTNNISASLYQKKDRDNLLLPIEKNHISDGIWDKNKQQIIFDLNEKLVAVNKYYLVLSFPEDIKDELRTGKFDVIKENALLLAIK